MATMPLPRFRRRGPNKIAIGVVAVLLAIAAGYFGAPRLRSMIAPSYSKVIATYPEGVRLCTTKASIEGAWDGKLLVKATGGIEIRDSQVLVKYYGTKMTVTSPVELDGKHYRPGDKLTVDKEGQWVLVSSWR